MAIYAMLMNNFSKQVSIFSKIYECQCAILHNCRNYFILQAGNRLMSRKIVYKDMTWPEIQERVASCNICIIPLGAMEQHGYHLPVGTDTYQIYEMARRAAERVA